MSPSRLLLAGLVSVLAALAMGWAAGHAVKSDPYAELYGPPEEFVFLQFFIGSLGGAGIFLILKGLRLALARNLPTRAHPRIFREMELRNLTTWKGRRVSQPLVMASLNALSVSWI